MKTFDPKTMEVKSMFDTSAMDKLRKAYSQLREATSKIASRSIRDGVDGVGSAITDVEEMLLAINRAAEHAIQEAVRQGIEEGQKPSKQNTRQCGTCKNNGVLKCMAPMDGSDCPSWEMIEIAPKDDLAGEQPIPPEDADTALENLRRAIGGIKPGKFGSADALFEHLKRSMKKPEPEPVHAATAEELHQVSSGRQIPIIEALKILQEVYDASKAITELNRWMYEHKDPTRYVWSYVSNQAYEDLPGCYVLVWKIEQKQPGTGTTAKLVFKGPVSKIDTILFNIKFPKDEKGRHRLVDDRNG